MRPLITHLRVTIGPELITGHWSTAQHLTFMDIAQGALYSRCKSLMEMRVGRLLRFAKAAGLNSSRTWIVHLRAGAHWHWVERSVKLKHQSINHVPVTKEKTGILGFVQSTRNEFQNEYKNNTAYAHFQKISCTSSYKVLKFQRHFLNSTYNNPIQQKT